ncbi:HD domain-containing protein [Pelosinus sp. IPA-1]|uniref:HD domain-containing protein n=1 Tax=Pelosinus sp. IPA-1 TaxID=3029569 RepID=UPI00243629FF|nr:HD domain-containing protein [Pelosinus sp. IPA-1]GMA97903.1 HD family phosphohydrolase [Pelosinus sp. IPA-1]
MFNRLKQVIAALTAKITQEDRNFVSFYLSSPAEGLFWNMNVPDQRHALNVAYTALDLAKSHPKIDAILLVKCALLHDVGKIKNDVSTFDKIITVIGHRLAPSWAKKWGRLGRGNKLSNLRHAFYVYFHHAERSAAMLRDIGECPQIIEIVRIHHKTPAENDPLELVILRKSDNMH